MLPVLKEAIAQDEEFLATMQSLANAKERHLGSEASRLIHSSSDVYRDIERHPPFQVETGKLRTASNPRCTPTRLVTWRMATSVPST